MSNDKTPYQAFTNSIETIGLYAEWNLWEVRLFTNNNFPTDTLYGAVNGVVFFFENK